MFNIVEVISLLHLTAVILPVVGGLLCWGAREKLNATSKTATFATGLVWLSFTGFAVLLWLTGVANPSSPYYGLSANPLGLILALLITFVSGTLHAFALRYMHGDRRFQQFFSALSLITASTLLMVTADNIWLLWSAWTVSNGLLVSLMIHKPQWQAAKASGYLAAKTFGLGIVSLGFASMALVSVTGSSSLQTITAQADRLSFAAVSLGPVTFPILGGILGFIFLAALLQSAQWPLQRWLLSSMNSPTPVSALMHAGLVNGGGFLLARFAPLYFETGGWLLIIFVSGALTAFLGTMWMLVQSDIKRMLGCSTMGQMGFMFMQCGMGLFPAAVAHLCWHGLFKASLFLGAGSAITAGATSTARSQSATAGKAAGALRFLSATLIGLLGAGLFAYASGKTFGVEDTTVLLLGFAFIAATQAAYTLLAPSPSPARLAGTVLLVGVGAVLYGLSVLLIDMALQPLGLSRPQPLNGIYLSVFGGFLLAWLLMLLSSERQGVLPDTWRSRLYTWAVNASQPAKTTLTATRKQYVY